MALTAEDIAWVTAQIFAATQNNKVRIPELPNIEDFGEPDLADRIPYWMADLNKTVYIPLGILRSFILTGGVGTIEPVAQGNSVFVVIGTDTAEQDTYNLPSLAGKTFVLRRSGYGALLPPGSANPQYEILSAGGFKLIDGTKFSFGEVFELELNEPAGPLVNTTVNASFNGVLPVNASKVLNDTHIGKLIQVRAGSDRITITLPNVNNVPDNTEFYFESTILNQFPCKILTTAGQYIYFQNTGKIQMYLGISETLRVYRADDGWYVVHAYGNWAEIGTPSMKWKAGLNEVVADGAMVSRADYPRLWEFAQTLGTSLKTDAEWSSGGVLQPFRGCFSSGDLSTTFRLPDLRNMFLRGLEDLTTSGVLNDRQNIPGGYQIDQYKAHDHALHIGNGSNPSNVIPDYVVNDGNNTIATARTEMAGGIETRGKNIGLIPVIKC
jgi:microcystin-dependent protein